MSYENILFEVQEGVGILTFNRPKALNALNSKTFDEVDDLLDRIRTDETVRVLILTGAGDRAFIAGADITQFPAMTPLQASAFGRKGQEVFFKLESLPKPVIACVNGFALGGGCEAAMSCDFIFASEKAKFGQPEISLGILPGFGGTQRLSRLVGRAKAKEICMTGDTLDAATAKEIGLVARVFPAETLMEETMKVAKALAAKSASALSSVKRVVDGGFHLDLRSGCALEAEAFGMAFSSVDGREGTAAFLEKRKPEFKGTLER